MRQARQARQEQEARPGRAWPPWLGQREPQAQRAVRAAPAQRAREIQASPWRGSALEFFFQPRPGRRSEEHTSELQSQSNLVCRLLLEKKKTKKRQHQTRDR